MKQKFLPALCIVLAAALLLSVAALIFAKSEAKAAAQQVQYLMAQVQTLEEQNQALQLQLSYQGTVWAPIQTAPVEDPYCTLVVDTWQLEDNVLSVNVFAQAVLPGDVEFSARLELQRADAVVSSQPITLDAGEAAGIFEADIPVSFLISEMRAEEELQLCLVVEPAGSDPLFACGAGWYWEDGRLLLITG